MYFFLLRWLLLLFLMGVGGLVNGQTRNSVDIHGNMWHHQDTINILSKPSQVWYYYPRGEVYLPRFGAKNWPFEIGAKMVKSGLNVRVLNKDGIPFRSLNWKGIAFDVPPADGEPKFESTALIDSGSNLSAKLRIKPALQLNRQAAVLNIQRKLSGELDTIIYTVDSLSKRVQSANIDTFLRCYTSLIHQKPILVKWKLYKELETPGQFLKQTGILHVVPKKSTKTLLTTGYPVLNSRLGRIRAIQVKEFKSGDTLIFMASVKGKTPLKKIFISNKPNSSGNQLNGVVNALTFPDTIVADSDTPLFLNLKSKKGFRKQYTAVSVWRIRAAAPDSFYVVTDSLLERKTEWQYDTLVITAAFDSLALGAIWNIENEPTGGWEIAIPITVDSVKTLSHIAYWVGAGRECLTNYQYLEETKVPPEWVKPGGPPALVAYGLGHSVALPWISADEIVCSFSTKKEINKYDKQKRPPVPASGLPKGRNAGILSVSELKAISFPDTIKTTRVPSYNFYARFQNTSTVNPYPVSIKIVAFYTAKKNEKTTITLLKKDIHTVLLVK